MWQKLGIKNEDKVNWLVKKYEMKYDSMEDMSEHERKTYGMAVIFNVECSMKGDDYVNLR